MSINVNVTGNPVRIHRGKMVTANPDYAKEEFQKRRRMRLEQVRQQSKDIAETVRNKVRNEQNRQLSDMEKRGENELKKWQTRKLLQLQQQYDECLKDIGLGHSDAILEEESDYAMEARKENYDDVARERGHRAAEKLHREKYDENTNKSAGLQKRNYNLAIENARAKLVADINRNKKSKSPFKKKKRKVSTDINISSRLSGGSDSASEVPEFLNISSSSNSSATPAEAVNRSFRKDHTVKSDKANKQRFPEMQSIKEKVPGQKFFAYSKPKINETKRTCASYPQDTRISDRIRSRTILRDNCDSSTNICDISDVLTPHKERKAFTIRSDQHTSPEGSPRKLSPPANPKVKTVKNSEEETDCYAKCGSSKANTKVDLEEIPIKPLVTIRTAPESSNRVISGQTSGSPNKVQYYDHKNRFTKKYVADNSSVQRIPEESIEVCPTNRSDAEFKKQMFKRDQDAQVRGQKALQKEKVHKDYRDMMQQLPVLQKQERVASIASKKNTFHMSEDRLKHHEKKKQNQMEDAYEKLFPKARVITIPPKNHTKASTSTSTLPFQTIDINDNRRILNVGTWDVDAKPKNTSDLAPKHVESNLLREATARMLGETTNPEKEAAERKENLQDMLRSLQFHRDKLAKELSSLPESSNLHKLFGELGHIDKLIRIGQDVGKESPSSGTLKRSRSRKKDRSENRPKVSSSSASPSRLETVREELEKVLVDRRTSKYHTRCTSGSSTSPSPPSKILSTKTSKTKRKGAYPPPLILQNTSTQTTPVVTKSKEDGKKQDNQKQAASPKSSTASMKLKPRSKEIEPCECYVHTENEKTELCEIVIKITDDGKPEICVGHNKLKDNQVIVKTNDKEVTASVLEPSSLSTKTEQPGKSISFETRKPKVSKKRNVIEKPKAGGKPKKEGKQSMPIAQDQKSKNKDNKEKLKSSWREYLSQNSTSSTSYLSPPDFSSMQPTESYSRHLQQSCNTLEVPKQKPAGHLMNILKDKPQQFNLQDNTTASTRSSGEFIEPKLFFCIKKLLTMSRKSIDNLTVSSVSEISTPSASVVNMQSNISTHQLDNFMKHFNINMTDLQEFLNYSPGESNIHYNTAESLSLSPTVDRSRSPNCTCNDESETAKPQELKETSFNDYATQTYPNVLAAYNKLAENCAKKIENLAAMIEKVRLEKVSILQSPGSGSDKENSTKYLDLPQDLGKQNSEKNESPSPNSSILEQQELDRQLLLIDYSFAERLKKMTPAEIREQYPLNSSYGDSSNTPTNNEENDQQRDSIDQELMTRYKNLMESYKTGPKTNLDENSNCACPPSTNEDRNAETPFVPLLDDIPRWPKLEIPTMTVGLQRKNEKSKPPPSKGISVAKRFNNDINTIPHELSAIIESESLMSSRLHKSKTPESRASSKEPSPKQKHSFDKNLVVSSDLQKPAENSPHEKITYFTVEKLKPPTSSSGSLPSLPDILIELMTNTSEEVDKAASRSERSPRKSKTETSKQLAPVAFPEPPSDSSSDLENMEAMLKSLGMGWAIATLRKTQEALALTSSSSSIDISVTRQEMKLTDTSSPSEISVRGIVGKHLLTKLSSTTDSSGSSQFLRELHDLSAIYGSEISREKTTQRTSTPVQSGRSADKSKSDSQPRITITGESELSSVKVNSDSNSECVPFYSLNESSIKSKNSSKND